MRRVRVNKHSVNSGRKNKISYTLTEENPVHKARVYGITALPTGEFKEVELGTNKVLIGGFREFSHLLYNKRPNFTKPTFEDELYKGSDTDLLPSIKLKDGGRLEPYVQAFNVSYDGSQGDGVVDAPRHKDGWDFEYLIPFRVIPIDLNDYSRYKETYLHHRIVTINSKQYVEYYSKKINITVTAQFKDGTLVPDNPNVNVNTDLDSRLVAEFPVQISEEELIEHWRLRKEEGAEGAHYNSTMMMIGQEAEIQIGAHKFPSMLNTHVYAKSNHVSVAHGVDAFLSVKYQLLHV